MYREVTHNYLTQKMKWHIHTGVYTITYVWSTVTLNQSMNTALGYPGDMTQATPPPPLPEVAPGVVVRTQATRPHPSPRRRVGCEASICLLGAPAPEHHHPSTWTHTQTYMRTHIHTYVCTYILYLHLHQSHHPIYTKNVFLPINPSLVHKYVCRQL